MIRLLLILVLWLLPSIAVAADITVQRGDTIDLCLTITDTNGHVAGQSPTVMVTKLDASDVVNYYNWTTPGWDTTFNATNHRKALVENTNAERYCVNWDQPSGDPINYQYQAVYRNTGTPKGVDIDFINVSSQLSPTTVGRTLDVTATGEAGLDFDNTAGTLQDADIDTITVNPAAGSITTATFGTGAINAAAMDDDLERRLGPFIKQITVTSGSTVAEVVSTSGLTEASANAYEKTVISCSTNNYTEPRRILRFDPATDKVIISPSTTTGRVFSTAPATNDTCNIYAVIE